jgi:hypothetical protein
MAQLGDFMRAKALLRSAARAFGPSEAVARARCVVAEAEVARHECDLRFSDDTPRASDRVVGTKSARRAPQQGPGSMEIPELRHGDPAKRERRGVVSQRDALQRTQRIAGCKRLSRGGDQ